ncbi:hypothetical protein [Pedobacter sp. Hv1]|uniref:hypothetical protein n=1 Tax=Pedobacter sp. Hv1 TaxID=1740090 RepID=UPI0006D8C054|nr:hypothetical protein [Pedobacter sp. Hv1]KQC00164.1 hypothetical protein AQF98_11705 [Pedobacter sp. Hv1]
MPKLDIEKKIAKEIEAIKAEISKLESRLQEWEKISNDYQINKVTIESILSLHAAPDLSGSSVGTKSGIKVKSTSNSKKK